MSGTPNVSAIESSLEMYSGNLSEPLLYLSANQNQRQEWVQILECLYNHLSDVAAHEPVLKARILLPKLLVQNFDEEQIWQQVELLNNVLVDNVQSEINKKLTEKVASPQRAASPDTPIEPSTFNEPMSSEEENEDLNIELEDKRCEVGEGKPGFDLTDMDKFCEEVEREHDQDADGSEDEADIFGDSMGDNTDDEKMESKLEMELRKVSLKNYCTHLSSTVELFFC